MEQQMGSERHFPVMIAGTLMVFDRVPANASVAIPDPSVDFDAVGVDRPYVEILDWPLLRCQAASKRIRLRDTIREL